MKKSKWKRVMALGLATVMTISCAGCATKKGDEKGGDGSNVAVDPAAAKQYVYHYDELKMDNMDSLSIHASRVNGDKIEVLTSSYVYDETGDGETFYLVTLNKDGSDVKSTKMQILPSQQAEEAEQGTEDQPSEPVEDGDVSILPVDDDYWTEEDYRWENSYFQGACLDSNGVYAIRNHMLEYYDNGQYVSEQNMSVCAWNKDGSFRFEIPFDMSQYQNEDTYSYVQRVVSLGDNKLAIILGGDESGLISIDETGKTQKLSQGDAAKKVFANDASLAERNDGTFLVAYYNDDWSKQFLTTFNPKDNSFGQEYEVPAAARNKGFYNFSAGIDKDVVFSTDSGVFAFNLGDTEVTKIMDYVNSDLASYGLNNIVVIDSTHFMATYYDPMDYRTRMAIFTYVKPEDIQDKKVLVYAGFYIDSDVKQQIIRFNKKENEYRITIRDYSDYNTDDDYSAGLTKLNNDIIAGNIPDIIQISSSMPIDSFVEKKLLADIDEYIKKDEELSKIEYMDNVFEAYRIKGKLYRVIPTYTVNTWVGKKSLIGNKTSWKMDEVKQAAAKLNGDKSIFGMNITKDWFLSLMMNYAGSDFVDINTGKCNFDNQNFIDLLEYAKTLPDDAESGYDEDYWEHYWETYQSQYRENRTLLMQLDLSSSYNIRYNINGMIGEDVAYVGFPTESGKGSYIGVDTSFAMSDKSENKDGAWKFLRFFLTEEYQKNDENTYGYRYGLSILKSEVRKLVDETMERPYWIDYDGTKVEYDDTFYMNGQEIVIQPFSKAQADELFNFLCSVNTPSYYDEKVMEIVSEEAQSFFAGSKSAADVASMIQSRVQLYVNENK